MKAHDAARAAMAQAEETRAWFTTDEINAWAEKKLKENPQWTPDWDTQAVLVEEMQRMAKRIEDLEVMPKEVDVKHKTKYYALLKEYDRVCYLLDKATDKITDQDLMLTAQTARIVDLQDEIRNLTGEE